MERRGGSEDETTMDDAVHVPDAELVAQYRGGNVDAIECLVLRYRRPLFGFIVNMVSSGPEADEVFQEVWFRVLKKISLYRDQNFKAWLMRIAHNLVIDRVRSQRNYCSLDAGWDEEDGASLAATVPAQGPTPDARAEAGDLGRRIAKAVETLPPEQRAVFIMRVEQDLPFREIARIQGVPLNTALGRMHYAVGKLRAILKDDYEAVTAGEPAVSVAT
jgi:RNA polymerase sigma-70 factor, ECF subfamily